MEECINRFLIAFGDTAAPKGVPFLQLRNVWNAMKNAHYQLFLFHAIAKSKPVW
jgi:hypothetical protein